MQILRLHNSVTFNRREFLTNNLYVYITVSNLRNFCNIASHVNCKQAGDLGLGTKLAWSESSTSDYCALAHGDRVACRILADFFLFLMITGDVFNFEFMHLTDSVSANVTDHENFETTPGVEIKIRRILYRDFAACGRFCSLVNRRDRHTVSA